MPSVNEILAWRDGDLLVLRRSSPTAPDRCIVTNELVFGRSKISRRLSWGSDGPASWIPTKIKLLWALANMKLITVTFGLSGKVKAARYSILVLSAVCVVIGIGLFVEGLQKGGVPPPMGYLGGGAALIAVALTLSVNTYSIIDIVAMDEEFVWLRGAKKPFLASLPLFSKNKEPNLESSVVRSRHKTVDEQARHE